MADHSIPAQRSTFLADAQRVLAEKYRLQNRVTALESTLTDCLGYIEGTWGLEDDLPEPECSIEAKRLLGWKLG